MTDLLSAWQSHAQKEQRIFTEVSRLFSAPLEELNPTQAALPSKHEPQAERVNMFHLKNRGHYNFLMFGLNRLDLKRRVKANIPLSPAEIRRRSEAKLTTKIQAFHSMSNFLHFFTTIQPHCLWLRRMQRFSSIETEVN